MTQLLLLLMLVVIGSCHSLDCPKNWHSIGDSCYLLGGLGTGDEDEARNATPVTVTARSYLSAKLQVCAAMSSALVDARICEASTARCNQWQLELERLLLAALPSYGNDSLLIGARLEPDVNGLAYYWDRDALQLSLRPWTLEARRSKITQGMLEGSENVSLEYVDPIREALASGKHCLSVIKVSDELLRYRPVRCNLGDDEPDYRVMCRLTKFRISGLLVVCYALSLALLLVFSGFVFEINRAALFRS